MNLWKQMTNDAGKHFKVWATTTAKLCKLATQVYSNMLRKWFGDDDADEDNKFSSEYASPDI